MLLAGVFLSLALGPGASSARPSPEAAAPSPSFWLIRDDGPVEKTDRVDTGYRGAIGIYVPGRPAVVLTRAEFDAAWARHFTEPTVPAASTEKVLHVRFDPPIRKGDGAAAVRIEGAEKNERLERLQAALASVGSDSVTLRGLSAGSYTVKLEAPYRVPLDIRIDTESPASLPWIWPEAAGLSIQVPAAATANADVRVGDGKPIALQLLPRAPGARTRSFPTVWFAPDRSGRVAYHVRGYGRGAMSMDVPLRTIETVSLDAGQSVDVRVTASRPGGAALADFTLTVLSEDESRRQGGPAGPPLVPERLESRQGSVEIPDLPRGNYTVWASAAGLPATRIGIDLSRERRRQVPLRVAFEEGTRFRIHIPGAPHTGLRVSAATFEESGSILSANDVKCSEPRECELILSTAVAFVSAVAESPTLVSDMPGPQVPASAGETWVELHRKTTVAGRTVRDGEPAAAAEVVAVNASNKSTTAISDSEGRWSLALAPGEWRIAARDEVGRRSRIRVLRAARGEAIDNVDLELLDRLAMTGTTVDGTDGKPIPYVDVEVVTSAPSPVSEQRTLSDGAGEFRLEGVSDGVFLVARKSGYAAKQQAVPPPPDPEAPARHVAVVMEPECGLDVTVFDSFGTVKPGAEISVFCASGYSSTQTTDAAGQARFDSLPSGELSIFETTRSWTLGASEGMMRVRAQVTLTPGEHRQITVGGPGIDVTLRASPPKATAIRLMTSNGDFRVVVLDQEGTGTSRIDPSEPLTMACSVGIGWQTLLSLQPTPATQTIDLPLAESCTVVSTRTTTEP